MVFAAALSPDPPSLCKELTGFDTEAADAPLRKDRSSLRAARDISGGPSSIPQHTEASTIHAGNSRDTLPRTSTWTTALPPWTVLRNSRTRFPWRGCQRYSTTTKPNRYAECGLIPRPREDSVLGPRWIRNLEQAIGGRDIRGAI